MEGRVNKLFLVVLTVPVLCGCDREGARAVPAEPLTVEAEPAHEAVHEQVDLTLPPVSTYASACARCHGDGASNHLEQLRALHDDELRPFIEDMMWGPGFLEPTEHDIDAMTAYHRALIADEPFVVVTNGESAPGPKALAIETSPGATFEINSDDGTLTIRATRGDQTTEISFPARLWSHARN